MPDGFTVKIDDTHARLKFDVLPTNVRDALFAVSTTLERALLETTRARANGQMVGVRTGEYLSSIKGSTRRSKNSVKSIVRSKSPLAYIIESGANIGAHDILPKAAEALHFGGSAGDVFAAVVHHPAVVLPPKPVIDGAFEDMRDTIVSDLETAARKAAQGTFV